MDFNSCPQTLYNPPVFYSFMCTRNLCEKIAVSRTLSRACALHKAQTLNDVTY